ncbi:hypothetical protein LCGC14_0637470 [marine sediment metagenome]|uniref:ASCH domain-containing protein n=1 Tax=marine sediment metagenome TaxID=412755 RepID=A0A0F9TLJ8_9ZZZZ
MSKPILFSTPMVKAILEGRKTQARWVIVPSNTTVCGYPVTKRDNLWTGLAWNDKVFQDGGPHILHPSPSQYLHVPWINPSDGDDDRIFRVRSRWEIGDQLWVRETHYPHPTAIEVGHPIMLYKARGDTLLPGHTWKPSIFMPRWASRITLEITHLRVERLDSISVADIEAEGFQGDDFFTYWDSLNAKRGFGCSVNPWLWVLDFKEMPDADRCCHAYSV